MAVHAITRGLDIPLAGAPTQRIDEAPEATRVALVAADYIGLKPTLRVQVGDRVERGSVLFEDKRTPGVAFTAPAAGTIAAVHRGDRRALQSVVIDVDRGDGPERQVAFSSYDGRRPSALSVEALRALLVESGMWTAFRTRPFSKVPAPDTMPRAVFVTAMDTHPHAPDVGAVLAGSWRRLRDRACRHRDALPRPHLRLPGRRRGTRHSGASRRHGRGILGSRTRRGRRGRTSISSTRSTTTASHGTSATRTSPPSDTS